MKSTFEIVQATAELFYRFYSQMPYNYMQEVFGKEDEELAEKCLQSPKSGSSALLLLICSLKPDERKALVKYINKRNNKY
jgi:hypothetical protein